MASTIIYLENFVESTTFLPVELQRILNTIKSLDERSMELLENIKRNVEALTNIPTTAGRSTPEEAAEADYLQKRIDVDERQLLQFGDEKVQLAIQAQDLLHLHLHEAQRVVDTFETEVAPAHAPAGAADGDFSTPFQTGGASTKKGGGGAAAAGWADGFATLDAPPPTSKRQAAAAAAAAGMVVTGGLPPAAPTHKMRRQQQARDAAEREAALAGGVPQVSARKIALAQQSSGHLASMISSDLSYGGASGGEEAPPTQYAPIDLPPGMQHASEKPQKPGRVFTSEMIGPVIKGRRAEMYWPDDNMWYLIEIIDVNMQDRSAHIVYSTGETEVLNLDEIAQDGHMSLIENW